jgi:hypothetical protein
MLIRGIICIQSYVVLVGKPTTPLTFKIPVMHPETCTFYPHLPPTSNHELRRNRDIILSDKHRLSHSVGFIIVQSVANQTVPHSRVAGNEK